MRGYYEWTGDKGDKQPHFIHGDGPILAAAGISTARKEDGGWVVSTAIITREARDRSGELHDRMPAFLTRDVWDEWLNPHKLESDAEKEHLLALLTDTSGTVAATITSYEVDRRVNNSRNIDEHDATLIEPVAS
jgi:putative SOS response-associated peptidase YedK